MKKILSVLLSLVVAFVAVVSPVFAAGQRSKVEVLYTPPTVYQGETFDVSFKVTARGGKTGKWQVEFPKSVVSAVGVVEKRGLSLSDAGDSYVLTFNLKQLKSQNLTVKLTVSSVVIGEDVPLLSLYDQNGTFVEQRQVDVLVPKLALLTSISATEVLAGEPFFWALSISNPTNQVLSYNFNLESWYTCAQTNPVISSPLSAQLMRFNSDQFHTVWEWEGSVNPGEVVNWGLEMITRPTALPDCGIIKLKNNMSATEEIVYIDVLPNSLPPHGKMVMSNAVVGQPATLEVFLYSPNYTQFVMGAVTSPDCQITDLPAGVVSSFPVTYKKFIYHPVVVAANSGQTGSVICHLTTTFEAKYSGYPDMHTIESAVEVVFP